MELASQEFHLTGEPAVRFAFAHKMVKQICLGYYKTNQDLFSVGNITTKLTLYNWIIDDDTVKDHLKLSGIKETSTDLYVTRLRLIHAATEVPQRIEQRRNKGYT